MSDIKKAITAAISQRGLTHRELAKKMKVTEGAVHHWAKSDRDLRMSTINKVAKALKLSTSDLVAMGE